MTPGDLFQWAVAIFVAAVIALTLLAMASALVVALRETVRRERAKRDPEEKGQYRVTVHADQNYESMRHDLRRLMDDQMNKGKGR